MAPARPSRRAQTHDERAARPHAPAAHSAHDDDGGGSQPVNSLLFLDPMLGNPLSFYIEKDVQDRDLLVDLIAKGGGIVAPGYSNLQYILVDPHTEAGQNLYRQYAKKASRVVLHARWIHECVKAGSLQTFKTNWAGCRVDGTEKIRSPAPAPTQPLPSQNEHARQARHSAAPAQDSLPHSIPPQPQTMQQTMPPIPHTTVDPLVHSQDAFAYSVYSPLHPPRTIHPHTAGPPQSWQAPNGIAPQQTHIAPPPQPALISRAEPFRNGAWEPTFNQGPAHSTVNMVGGPAVPPYDYRYRDDQPDWGQAHDYSYDPTYEQSYEQAPPYVSDNGPSGTSLLSASTEARGRKRPRNEQTTGPLASTLVLNRRNPPARSPTPPTRVIKSTYGGNLFTADDVLYLKRYIDYCQEEGLVLSLREICERIAIKAPHHTFYSWRRYCNKHQIRLGGYSMDNGDSGSHHDEHDVEDNEHLLGGPGPSTMAATLQRVQEDRERARDRSPTPPRALFRSTTGKGVAFTPEDITFLVRFMEYRKSQGRLDMVAFWKDVAVKAPHHSRASWMKFWRRHKHELNRSETDEPIPQPPEKKMRYSRTDDILLARYFFEKPDGTSDKIFQAFGRLHPHHPWKGWQEHHRIHKAKIDHLIKRLADGEALDGEDSQQNMDVSA